MQYGTIMGHKIRCCGPVPQKQFAVEVLEVDDRLQRMGGKKDDDLCEPLCSQVRFDCIRQAEGQCGQNLGNTESNKDIHNSF